MSTMKTPDANIRDRLRGAARAIEFPEVPIEQIVRQGRRRLVVRSIGVIVASCMLVIALVVSLVSLSGLGGGEGSVIRGDSAEELGSVGVEVRAAVLRDAVMEFDLESPVRILDRVCHVTNPWRVDVRCHKTLPIWEQRQLEAAFASPATGRVSMDLRFVSGAPDPSLEILARRGIVLLGPVDRRQAWATAGIVLPPEVFGTIRYVGQRYRVEIDETGTWTVLDRECAAGCP
jgi:hypothetical protein